jgi:hypothetical protein
MLFFALSSFAAVSAPVRDERNTGLVELLAIMAMRMVFRAAWAWSDTQAAAIKTIFTHFM